MALDPRIALGVQPVQIQSPLEVANQIAGLRAAEQRNALNQAIGTGANYLMQRDLLNRIYPTSGIGRGGIPSGAGAEGVI